VQAKLLDFSLEWANKVLTTLGIANKIGNLLAVADNGIKNRLVPENKVDTG
jgi:hypothetical protein